MNIVERLCINSWNVGFIEDSVSSVIDKGTAEVHWLKHPYKDRFFADPFILDYDDKEIIALVEEFPYRNKREIISSLTIDRNSYELKEKKQLCSEAYHLSYPFILRIDDKIFVIPESSKSGGLFSYVYRDGKMLDKSLVMDEPLLDSTIIFRDGLWWLFCTKRGKYSNRDLFVYYSKHPLNEYHSVNMESIKSDFYSSRPAGNMIVKDNELLRVTQNCVHSYGENVVITKVNTLTTDSFNEKVLKEIDVRSENYKIGFHTINEYKGLTIVDGLDHKFRPVSKIYYQLCNYLK